MHSYKCSLEILTSLVVDGEVGFSQRHRHDLSVAPHEAPFGVDAGGLGGEFGAIWKDIFSFVYTKCIRAINMSIDQ